jgi:hypothetical protein
MTPDEQRAAMHRAVDQICDADSHAQLDARARGYTAAVGGDGSGSRGGHSDPTYGATLRANIADVWLAKTGQLRKDLWHQADMALKHWPPSPKPGDKIDGITIGTRTNQAELCWQCDQPATSGRDAAGRLLVRRVPLAGGGTATLHTAGCYDKAWRKAQAAGQAIAAYITANPANANTAGHPPQARRVV